VVRKTRGIRNAPRLRQIRHTHPPKSEPLAETLLYASAAPQLATYIVKRISLSRSLVRQRRGERANILARRRRGKHRRGMLRRTAADAPPLSLRPPGGNVIAFSVMRCQHRAAQRNGVTHSARRGVALAGEQRHRLSRWFGGLTGRRRRLFRRHMALMLQRRVASGSDSDACSAARPVCLLAIWRRRRTKQHACGNWVCFNANANVLPRHQRCCRRRVGSNGASAAAQRMFTSSTLANHPTLRTVG